MSIPATLLCLLKGAILGHSLRGIARSYLLLTRRSKMDINFAFPVTQVDAVLGNVLS